jgi:hypothetical protein
MIEGGAWRRGGSYAWKCASRDLAKGNLSDVENLYRQAHQRFGAVRFEWVHDGRSAWIVQLHRGVTQSSASIVVPGEAQSWREFMVSEGLSALRNELETLAKGEGIILVGRVGLTSHIADAIPKRGHPARIAQ